MPARSCHLKGMQKPFRVVNGGTPKTMLELSSNLVLRWSDGNDDPLTAFDPGQGIAITVNHGAAPYTGSTQVDGTRTTWLTVSYEQSQRIFLFRLEDFSQIDALFVATQSTPAVGGFYWAVLGWISGTDWHPSDQAGGVPPGTVILDSTATPAEGDLPVYKSGKWELLLPQGPGTVLMSSGVSTAPDYQTISTVLAYLLPHNGSLLVCNPMPVELTLPGTAPPSGKYWGLCSTTGTSVPQWVPVSP